MKKSIAKSVVASGILLGGGIAIAQAVSVPEPPAQPAIQQSVQAPTEAAKQQAPVNENSANAENNGAQENPRIAQADQGQRGQGQNMTPEQRQEQM